MLVHQLPGSDLKRSECEKQVRWTDEEHEMFVAGLKKYGLEDQLGPGGAELMALHMGNRTALQIKSHMQQYQKTRTERERTKRIKPCAACRRAKVKCQGVGTIGGCSRCKIKGVPCVEDSKGSTAGRKKVSEECGSKDGSRHRVENFSISPERPMAYPEGIISGWADLNIPMERGIPLPKSLVVAFRGFWVSDEMTQRILLNMTPKLLSTVLLIFRTLDCITANLPLDGVLPPSDWSQPEPWHNSTRCGVQSVVCRGCIPYLMAGLDINRFWSDLAGLHKEELVNRAFNGEMNIPTSELRQVMKLILAKANVFRGYFAGVDYSGLRWKPLYSRFTPGWGRGVVDDGILVRTTSSFQQTPDGEWITCNTSLVVVSPDEYEAAAAMNPESCEGYLTPVVGSKSAQELMSSRLLVDESFEHMNSCQEGRQQLDKAADMLLDRFRFVFDYAAEHNLSVPEPTSARLRPFSDDEPCSVSPFSDTFSDYSVQPNFKPCSRVTY